MIVLLGNPSSGEPPARVLARHRVVPATGNAYILLHHTIYFNGNGTSQALAVLLTYLVVSAVILGVLNWRRSEPPVPADGTEAAA